MYDTFLLYYIAYHEGDFDNLAEMRELLVDEIGKGGIVVVLEKFESDRLERQRNGDYRTLYEVMKDVDESDVVR